MAADLAWRDASDVLLTAEQVFAQVLPGADGAWTEYRVYNDFGGVLASDDAVDWWVDLVARLTDSEPFIGSGIEVLDRYWLEYQRLGGVGGATIDPGPVEQWGPGRSMSLPVLASGEGLRIQVRVAPHAGASVADAQISFSLAQRRFLPVPAGLFRTAGNGVALGLGHWDRNHLLSVGGGVVENPAAADNFVLVGDVELILAGLYVVELAQLLEFDDDAADGTMAAGESYRFRIYADASGVGSVKGDGAVAPVEPDLPAGALFEIAGGTKTEGAVIEDADLEQRWVLDAWGFSSAGLDYTIGKGRGVVGDRMIDIASTDTGSLADATTTRIWRRYDGALHVGTAAPADDPWSMPLYEVTTAGSVVTVVRDLRRFAGFGHELIEVRLRLSGGIAAADEAYGILPTGRDCQLLPICGAVVSLSDAGAGSSGSTIIDIEAAAPGSAFATVFTSQGSDDRRPTFAFDATALHQVAALPEVVQFQGLTRFRAVVDAVPAGGDPPAEAEVVLLFAAIG